MAIVTALLILVLATPAAVYAAEHTVGGSSGWTQFGDYSTWAAGEKFAVGDTLVFNYDSSHKVAEVSQNDYDSCSSSNAIQTYSDGATSITLSKPGPMYFICPAAGHCSAGMKLSINVDSATTAPTTSPSPSTDTTPAAPTDSKTTPASTTPASPTVSSKTPAIGSPPTHSTSTVSQPTGSNGAAGVFSSVNALVLVLGTVVGLMG